MDTAALKNFATRARTELRKEVGARIDVVLASNSLARVESAAAVQALEKAIAQDGREAVIERVAYTWFNRIIALRFMDANGHTSSAIVSPGTGKTAGQPEVLAEVKAGTFDLAVVPERTRERVIALLSGTLQSVDPQGEAYGLLLEAYCRHWNKAMPFMFEREGDYTELLAPAALLAEDSVRDQAVRALTDEACQEVEVIGWLYQFYISERKDEVFAGFKKNKKAGAAEIPAATQLFTPHWIVRYLVENSLGRLWLLNHPESKLAERMDYYIAPVDEETDFLKIDRPEDLKVLDPAVGSGHMLTYAFDLLYAIYEEQGYAPSEIPGLIIEHNLYGIEIDPRAGSLAAFALTMKAAARRKLFLKNPVQPHVLVLENVHFDQGDLDYLWSLSKGISVARADVDEFWNAFEHADTFGSLIQPNETILPLLKPVAGVPEARHTYLGQMVNTVLAQAEQLSKRYAVVVANPPYMGSKQMNDLLSQFMKDGYPDTKSDLFAGFIDRCAKLAGQRGAVAMITMQSWMFLSSYEKLRASLLTKQRIASMLHLGARAFDSIGGEVVSATAFVLENLPLDGGDADRKRVGTFIRLVDGMSEAEKISALTTALEVQTTETGLHLASDSDFVAIPGSPIVYWLSEKMRAAFSTGRPLSEVANLRQGMATADNSRFLRQSWEVSRDRTAFACESREAAAASGARWFPYNKGGEFRKWYGNQEHVVNWEHDGAEIVAFKPRSVIRNPGTYFSPSVSWSDISSGEAAFRRYPPGFIYANTGHSGFGDDALLDRVALLLNSTYATQTLRVLAPTMHFDIGYVGLVPVAPGVKDLPTERLDGLVRTAQADWDSAETSWRFETSPLIALRSFMGGNLD